MAELPLEQAIPRFKTNEDRIDIFVNGNEDATYTTSSGVPVPSIRNIVANIGGDLAYSSGNWTPTILLGTNATAATAGACVYQRVGDVVEVSGRINVTAAEVDVTTVVNVTLPVPSTLRGGDDGGGLVLSTRGEVGDAVTNYVSSTDVLTLTWTCKLTTGHAITFNAMYMIR